MQVNFIIHTALTTIIVVVMTNIMCNKDSIARIGLLVLRTSLQSVCKNKPQNDKNISHSIYIL